jgi:hypothetical protein
VEEAININITEDSLIYNIRHFKSIDSQFEEKLKSLGFSHKEILDRLSIIGSKFNEDFVSDPVELVEMLNQINPQKTVFQENGRIALIFQFSSSVGTDSLIKKMRIISEERKNIYLEERGSFNVGVIQLDYLPQTNQIVVIVDAKSYNLVTLYPGIYAPSFPTEDQSKGDNQISLDFWKKHLFIKIKQNV